MSNTKSCIIATSYDGLKAKGAIFIEDIDDVPVGARLIYSAHGVSPAVSEHAKQTVD